MEVDSDRRGEGRPAHQILEREARDDRHCHDDGGAKEEAFVAGSGRYGLLS
jgi:hypothetical protein